MTLDARGHHQYLDGLQRRVRELDHTLSNRDITSMAWWNSLGIKFLKVKLYFEGRNEIEEAQANERKRYFNA